MQTVTTTRGRRGEPGALAFVPESPRATLPQLRAAANRCKGCDLYKNATQAVFGEIVGAPETRAPHATFMLIGEQPGDREDIEGHPFVGPAGKLLTQALAEAGIPRGEAYITNVVKHFKWIPSPRGKRRLHQKPSAAEVYACGPWLEREIALVKPRVLMLLGATAAQALMGPSFKVTRERGKVIPDTSHAASVVATVHPSSILRAPEDADREALYKAFVADLKVAARAARPK